MLLVASETGHVYTFATRKLQPMITSENGKALIQTCLNSPDSPASESDATSSVPSAAAAAVASNSTTDTSNFNLVKSTAANHMVSIPQQLPLSDHSEKLPAQQVITVILIQFLVLLLVALVLLLPVLLFSLLSLLCLYGKCSSDCF